MNILHISNYFYIRGGDCTYLMSLVKLMEAKGHKNIIFSMHDPLNFKSEYSKYFVSHINYADEIKNKSIYSGINVLLRSIYSLEAKRKIENLIQKEKPDIAHIQSLHHNLTHSILYPLKKYKIPIVWTLHDYALICPNTHFLSKGRICEKCRKQKYYRSIMERCKKDSLAASTVAMIEATVHRVMKIHELVDVFITPSQFLKNKLLEYGFKRNKIECINNFISLNFDQRDAGASSYYLYIGRLTIEKGIRTLIDAAIKMKLGTLKIVGDGPLRKELMSYVETQGKGVTIEFLGYKQHDEVINLIRNCNFVVLPSEWYENFPYAIIEAFALGKPVIGAEIGGIPEIIKNDETGLLFESGNLDDLYLKIKFLIENPDKALEMGKRARAYFEQEFNPEKHYKKLIEIYRDVSKQN